MKSWKITIVLLLLPLAAGADVSDIVDPLPCGIYDESARPLVEKDLITQSKNRAEYTMELTTAKGRKIAVEVQNVSIQMAGERNHVSVFVDGKPFAKTSHQDIPLYLEVHVDNEKYRIICVRVDEAAPEPEQKAAAPENKKEVK